MALQTAVTEVGIANLALAGLGQATITAFAGNTQQEILSALWYPIARDALLEQTRWSFATERQANLAALTATPAWGFTKQFQKPTGALKVWEVEGDGIPWRVEGDKILSNLDKINVVYTVRVVDPTKYTPLFVVALGKWLEALLAIPLTGKAERRKAAQEEASAWLTEAASSDGQQGTPNQPLTDTLNEVRW